MQSTVSSDEVICAWASTEKTPRKFVTSPPKLNRLAAQEMALVIYRTALREIANKGIEDDDALLDCCYEVKDDPEYYIEVHSPVSRELISKAMHVFFRIHIAWWFEDHFSSAFYDCSTIDDLDDQDTVLRNVVLNCIDELILKPDGSINYRQTAKNLLKSDKWDLVVKFRLACVNCMEDDVRNIWPLISDDPRVTKCDPKKHFMVHYWMNIMKGEPRRYPGDKVDSLLKFVSLFDPPFRKWTDIENFWEVSSEDDQISVAVELLREEHSYSLGPLLFNLKEAQLREVLVRSDVGHIFSEHFAEISEWYPELNLDVWNYLKTFIRPHEFQSVLEEIIGRSCNSQVISTCQLLPTIWKNTPPDLKNHLLSDTANVEGIFNAWNVLTYSHNEDYDTTFFITLLADLPFPSRNTIWCKYWHKLITRTTPKRWDYMIKLCFEDEEKISRFKKCKSTNFHEVKDFYVSLISHGHASRLEEFLNYCSSDVRQASFMKRKVLEVWGLEPMFSTCMKKTDFITFDKFIDSAFSNEDDARNWKRNLLSNCKKVKDFYEKVEKGKLGVSWE